MWVKLENPPLRDPFPEYILNLEASFTHYCHLHGPSLAQQIICDKILLSHTRRWYQFLFLNHFFSFSGFFCFLFLLFYVILLLFYKNYSIIIILFNFFFFSWKLLLFFHVPGCSGMLRVPGFIDARWNRGFAVRNSYVQNICLLTIIIFIYITTTPPPQLLPVRLTNISNALS